MNATIVNATGNIIKYEIDKGDTVWIMVNIKYINFQEMKFNLKAFLELKTCACILFLMFPGLGYFYGGLTHRKNLLTLLLSTSLSLAVVFIQWFVLGYSLCFSESGSVFIGNMGKLIDYLINFIIF